MKFKYTIVTFFILFAVLSLNAQNYDIDSKKIKREAKKLIRKKKVPGISISIIKNDSLVFSEGFGYANIQEKVKVNPKQTLFRIASISKSISAYGLAKAVELNLVNLDTSIYTYIPNFPKKKYDFTLRDLGGHIAGIRSYKGNEFKNAKALSIKEGIDLFKLDTLLYQPKTNYKYTSYGWNLISLAIQNASKLPFEEFMQHYVLNPLQLNATLPDRNLETENKAKFYRKKHIGRGFVEVDSVHNFFKLAGGGYLSTSEDVVNFGRELLKFSNINKSLFKEFITSQKLKDGKKTYYGIGFQTSFDHKNRPYYGHFGSGLGGYGLLYVYPEENIVIVLLMNSSDPKQKKRFNKIIDLVLEN